MFIRRYVTCVIQSSIDNCLLQLNQPAIYGYLRKFSTIGDRNVPSSSRVVVCGGGVMGASVAYHLALLGWGPETVVVEQHRIGAGTTWNSSGLVGVFKPSLAQVKLTKSSAKLYEKLESEGLPCGWKKCGSLNVARTSDRMTMFRRMKDQSVSWDIECELLTPEECKKKCPLLFVDDLVGGIWIEEDGVGDPYKVCNSLLHEAIKMGVTVVENCPVTKVIQRDERITGVETMNGNINCEYFVNCAGFWARDVGQLSEPYVKVPLHAVEHYYLHTEQVPDLDPLTPVVRDQDGYVYFRENNGRLLAGGFEPVANPAFETKGVPTSTAERLLTENWDHFHVLLEQLLHRIPCLKSVVLDRLYNEPEAFSPDCKWIVGEAPEIQNYYVAAGMKTVGIAAAGGVGQATAEMIVHNDTSFDMYELEVSRFLGLHNNRKFLRDRVREVPAVHYSVNYPFHEFSTGRNLRMSPVYPKLKEAGAVFGQVMGYERPTWFEESNPHDAHDQDSVTRLSLASAKSFGKPHWFDRVALEYASCREGIGLSDYSSFTKIDLWSKGNEVVDALQYICSNDVDVPVNSIIHTGMQNENGGYENDCSLARISENRYMMIAPTIQQTRCKVWLKKHLPRNVAMSDVTSMYTALCIMGPFTRTMLSEMTETDLSPKNFPFFTHKTLDIGLANGVRTMNLTHTGELGYVLYIPNEFALHVYTSLIEAGKKYGIRHAGYYATRALRVEKFYAFWGQDLDTRTTPLECGRVWRVKFDKNINFIGRDALLRQRDGGIERKYVQLILDDDFCSDTDFWPWGGEPIYRNGKYVGTCTTTGYGYTFKRQVCLGFIQDIGPNGIARKVTNDFVMSGMYEVDIGGIRFPARVSIHSPILPTKYPDKERDVYRATRNKDKFEAII